VTPRKRVGVVHEHEVLRRGIASCLADDDSLEVAFAEPEPPGTPGPRPSERASIDVAVVSPAALRGRFLPWPLVVVSPNDAPVAIGNGAPIHATIPLETATSERLTAAVRAVAAGLRIDPPALSFSPAKRFDERRLAVLRMIADGATTKAISEQLCYSERTIKSLIRDVEYELRAHSRAQAVAEAIRQGLI
jgi:DNA-binding NarL/FixJ family response regulator